MAQQSAVLPMLQSPMRAHSNVPMFRFMMHSDTFRKNKSKIKIKNAKKKKKGRKIEWRLLGMNRSCKMSAFSFRTLNKKPKSQNVYK